MSLFNKAYTAAQTAADNPTLDTVMDWLQAEDDYCRQYLQEGIPELETEAEVLLEQYAKDLTLLHSGLFDVTDRIRCTARIPDKRCERLADAYEGNSTVLSLLAWSEAEITQQRLVLDKKPAAANRYQIDLYDHYIQNWAVPALQKCALTMQTFRLKCHTIAPIFR